MEKRIDLISNKINENDQKLKSMEEKAVKELRKIYEIKNAKLKKKIQKAIDERKELINITISRFNEKEKRIEDECKKADDKITLNVGGKICVTTKATLLNISDSYFHGLLGSGFWQPDESGAYVIDRSFEFFPLILSFIRDGDVSILYLLDVDQMQLFNVELDYFLISLPAEFLPLTLDADRSLSSAFFSNNNLSVTIKDTSPRNWGCVIGTKAVDRFTVRIENHKWIHVGFIKDESHFKEKVTLDEYKNIPNYTFCNVDGSLRGTPSGMSTTWNEENAKFVSGDYITCIKEGTTIRFERNENDLGVAWTGLPEGPFYPYFANGRNSPSFTLVDSRRAYYDY